MSSAAASAPVSSVDDSVVSVAAVVFLLWLAFTPAINNLGQVLVIVALAVLAVVGIELLRRQTAEEFPPGPA